MLTFYQPFYWGLVIGLGAGVAVTFIPKLKQIRYLWATIALVNLGPLVMVVFLAVKLEKTSFVISVALFGLVALLSLLEFGVGYVLAVLVCSFFRKTGRKI